MILGVKIRLLVIVWKTTVEKAIAAPVMTIASIFAPLLGKAYSQLVKLINKKKYNQCQCKSSKYGDFFSRAHVSFPSTINKEKQHCQ